MRKITCFITLLIMLLSPVLEVSAAPQAPSITYRTHIQNIGWMSPVSNGQMSGTEGRGLRIEALQIGLNSPMIPGSIQYSAHVQNIGWQNPVSSLTDQYAGTSGRSLRVEAVRIALTGAIAQYYDIIYRVHVSNIGWMSWVSNGAVAGTTGFGLQAEAIEIRLVERGANIQQVTNTPVSNTPTIIYSAHVQNIGWQSPTHLGGMAGTTGRSLAIEGLRISVASSPISGGIQYSAHVAGVGWQPMVSDGMLAGTTGQTRQMEAVRISLTGELANVFDIYYRAHIQGYGWLDWASNGASAGSEASSRRLEALEIRIVQRGSAAPGATARPMVYNSPVATHSFPVSFGSTFIAVDITNQMVYFVRDHQVVLESPVVTGKPSTPTPRGSFSILSLERNRVLRGPTWASFVQFWMPFTTRGHGLHDASWQSAFGGNLFLTGRGSMGCVNMPTDQAAQLFSMIRVGTRVHVY